MNKAAGVFAQLAAPALLFGASLPGAWSQSVDNRDTEDIRAAIRSFETGWNRHDIDAMFQAFTPDAEWLNVVGMWWQGLQDVKRAHRVYHETLFANTSFNIDQIHVRLVTRDTAVAVVRWNKGSFLAPDGRQWPAGRDMMSLVLVRQGEHWLIAAGHNTTINEEAVPFDPIK